MSELYPAGVPDYAVPPGDTLAELMETAGAPRQAVADRLGLPLEQLEGLLAGRVPLDGPLAVKLEQETGVTARLWLRLEADYRHTLARLAAGGD